MTLDLKLDAGLPANTDAERTLLGAVLLDNNAWHEIRQSLRPDDFSLDSNRRIAVRMNGLMKEGRPVDIVTLANELNSHHEIEYIGGVAYLASLTEGLPRRPVISEYIRIVKDKCLLRRLMMICSSAITRAADQSEPALAVASWTLSQIEEVANPASTTDKAALSDFIVDALEDMTREYRERQSPCIPSGNAWFDHKTGGGYRHGKITLICARPNVGKTPWMVTSAVKNLQAGRKVVLFSLEMEKTEILRNMVPYLVDLPNVVVNRPWIQTPEQNATVNQAFNAMLENWSKLKVYDGEMDVDQICWTIDRETRNDEEVLFGLDHFGLISGGNAKDTRARYNENSARLRRKMKHKKAALMVLCQLRKVNREFSDKPPVPDDIKESGNMYEDAFAAVILHRAYEKDTLKMSRETKVNLCKLRTGGSTGTTTAQFNTHRLEFVADAEMEFADANYYE
jgi:replicative DNA helicase